jgi:Skp family chaperone for outer membrane proteins
MKSKTKVLLFLGLLVSSFYANAQRGVRIGYVDMEYILENVEEYRDATAQLNTKAQKWKVQIEQKQSVVEQMKKDLMAEKVLLTPELISEREEDIQILEKEMIEYQQDRFGPQGDLILQKRRLIQPIQDQVFNEVQKLGANKKYDFIFDRSADVVMLYAQKRHDISDLVLRGIARTRKISKPAKKASNRNSIADFEDEGGEDEEVVSDALQERLDKAKEATEARAKTADEKRTEQLKLREERKKAYEERRKKLLEEREAKKKEKEIEIIKDTEN